MLDQNVVAWKSISCNQTIAQKIVKQGVKFKYNHVKYNTIKQYVTEYAPSIYNKKMHNNLINLKYIKLCLS